MPVVEGLPVVCGVDDALVRLADVRELRGWTNDTSGGKRRFSGRHMVATGQRNTFFGTRLVGWETCAGALELGRVDDQGGGDQQAETEAEHQALVTSDSAQTERRGDGKAQTEFCGIRGRDAA